MAAGDLTDLATVKAWLNITPTTSDAQLGGLITAASTFIANYCGRQFLTATYTELYQGNGQDFMLLRQAPVTTVSGVQLGGGATINAGNALTLASGYYLDPDGMTLRLIGYRFPWRLPVQVAYTAGYAAAPADVAQACVELVGEAFKRRDRIGQTSKTLGGQEVIAFSVKDMNATIKAMLAPYQRLAPF